MAKCKSVEFTIPSTDGGRDGKLNWMMLSSCLYVGYVDIWSRYLPQCVFESPSLKSFDGTPIKINYCFRGRCEKKSLFRAFRINSQAEQSLV